MEYSFHDFGIGPDTTPIGTDTITLPVKGAPGHPAVSKAVWRTPKSAGHYCLKVQLHWPDDANPKNNLGQENTNVGVAASPARFRFPVRNDDTVRRTLRLAADAYTLPPLADCSQEPTEPDGHGQNAKPSARPSVAPTTDGAVSWDFVRSQHGLAAHPVPPGWSVEMTPAVLDLEAGQTEQVEVCITPPEEWEGRQAINVNATMGEDLRGGVTLYVTRDEGA